MTPTARLVRGWLSAAAATFLAAASHAAAGGAIPVLAVIVSLVAGALVCVFLAGRQLTLPRVVAGVAASQLVFHGLFEMFATGSATIGPAGAVGHGHDAGMSLPSSVLSQVPGGDGMSAAMLLSHVIAGITGVVLIRHAEQLWWALLAILGATIEAIMTVARGIPVADARRLVSSGDDSPFLYDLLHCDTRRRLRGPPTACSFT